VGCPSFTSLVVSLRASTDVCRLQYRSTEKRWSRNPALGDRTLQYHRYGSFNLVSPLYPQKDDMFPLPFPPVPPFPLNETQAKPLYTAPFPTANQTFTMPPQPPFPQWPHQLWHNVAVAGQTPAQLNYDDDHVLVCGDGRMKRF